jgi:hypothetical protein
MKHDTRKISEENEKKVDRRAFLSSAALLGGSAVLAGSVAPVFSRLGRGKGMGVLV